MSEIKKLIERLCPDGVEWEKLVENVDVLYGYPFDSRLFCEDETFMPLIRIRDVKPAKASTYYSGAIIEEYRITKGDILVGMDGNFNLEKWNDVDGLLNQRVCKLSSKNEDKILNGFIYHYLKPVFKSIEGELNSGTVIHLSAKRINKIEIPVPPIEVQSKIVEILDNFTELEAELEAQLEAELEARKKQYEYYRNQLLTFDKVGGARFERLKDVFEMRNGYTPSKNNSSFWDNGIIPWFRMEDIRENGRLLSDSIQHIAPSAIKGKGLFKANSIILATSATIGEHALISVEHLSNQRFTNIFPKKDYLEIIDMKFIFYYMFIIDEWCKQHTQQGSFASVDMNALYNLLVPIPPLEEQKRIVSILDRFEALTTDLQSGLPAEIEARRKQYEYYRGQLLTFKRKTA